MINKLALEQDLQLENGGLLTRPTIAYQQWGTPNVGGNNIVWVCHALTGNTNVMDWWQGLFGSEALFNERDWCIICPNTIGSCYGSVGPLDKDPSNGTTYFHDFPEITVKDMAAAHRALANQLGLEEIALLIGGSLGGQQALEWSIAEPTRFQKMILIATNSVHSAWGVAFNESQRMAIETDPTWQSRQAAAGISGLKTARSIALLSYRGYKIYNQKQPRETAGQGLHHPAIGYQRYQGEKLSSRFNAFSYWFLSKAMDSHDVGRNQESAEAALSKISAKTLIISIESDLLFPPSEQKYLNERIRKSQYCSIKSDYGHDGFLVETKAISKRIKDFIEHDFNRYRIVSFKTSNTIISCKQQ